MRFAPKPQNAPELLGLLANLVPLPLAHTHFASFLARIVYEAAAAGLFEALSAGPMSAAEMAAKLDLDPAALEAVLGALASAGYLRRQGPRFSLRPRLRKWLLRDSPESLIDQLLFMRSIWDWLDRLPQFLKSGEGLHYHQSFDALHWDLYQRGMAAVARISAREVARRTKLPPGARSMLDIGGANGIYAAALLRRHPALRATILDLPAAIEAARPLIAQAGLGERLRLVAGDALGDDLGEARHDLIFASSLLHHFTATQNLDLCRRAARALKPGGIFVIQDFVRPEATETGDAVGAVLNVFFALSSTSGVWRAADFAAWQAEAGLIPCGVTRFLTMPGFRQVAARRPA